VMKESTYSCEDFIYRILFGIKDPMVVMKSKDSELLDEFQ